MEASNHDEFREFVAMRSTPLLRLAVLLTGGARHAAEDPDTPQLLLYEDVLVARNGSKVVSLLPRTGGRSDGGL